MHLAIPFTALNCILLIILALILIALLIALYDWVMEPQEDHPDIITYTPPSVIHQATRPKATFDELPESPDYQDIPVHLDEWREPPCMTPDV